MRLIVAGFMLLGVLTESPAAEVRSFPYEALVDADSVFVHSGPGKKYYATCRLNQGDHVVVHRHDPGGWYMIAPPKGSFSWIRADAVNRLSRQRGVLTDNNVAVRVGSTLDESRDVFQARLSTGAAVAIVGEETVQTAQGTVRMLKIAPPQGEWRWISGGAITPVGQIVRGRFDRDPYKVPSFARRQYEPQPGALTPIKSTSTDGPVFQPRQSKTGATAGSQTVERPVVGSELNNAVHRRGPGPDALNRDRNQLKQLDDQFRNIIGQDTGEWDFTQLKQGYLTLQKEASHSAIASQVDLRLASLESYERIKANYDGFIRLTSETSRRDAELLAVQQAQLQAADAGTPLQPIAEGQPTAQWRRINAGDAASPQQLSPTPTTNGPFPATSGEQPATPVFQRPTPPLPPIPPSQEQTDPGHQPPLPGQNLIPSSNPVAPTFGNPQPPRAAVPQQTVPQQMEIRRPPRVRGSGIIQRAINPNTRTPQHVLLTPNGRILAYLQGGPGVDLNRFLGRAMGVQGSRIHRPDLQMDVFVVETLNPIRLQP